MRQLARFNPNISEAYVIRLMKNYLPPLGIAAKSTLNKYGAPEAHPNMRLHVTQPWRILTTTCE